MTEFVRMGTHNMVLPPEGPKVIPNRVMFIDTDKVTLDYKPSIERGFISNIQSAFVDNSKNDNVLEIETGNVGQVIRFPSRSQGYIMLFVTDDAAINLTTVKGPTVIIDFIACNTPVYPAIWKVE